MWLLALLLAALAAPAGAAITPANVSRLALKWEFPRGNPVTGAVHVLDGVVYVPSWDGTINALDAVTGAPRWTFRTGGVLGQIGGTIATPDGKLCFGNSSAEVICLNIADGSLAWRTPLGMPLFDAVWAQLGVANGRLFVGIASLLDQPCTHGRLVALDLATGMPLWTFQAVPDNICSNDTAVPCADSTDCGGAECVTARGAGVTASVIFDPTGNFVYMNTVGCYTFPSIGDSDTIFKLDAATGMVQWKNRVTPPEQFGTCAADSSVECSVDAHCAGVGGTCTNPKAAYHDFGFLNAPIRIEVPANGGGTETLIVSGSKDGTLYAFHENDGSIAWTNEVQPVPISPGFAGFGLFNGAIAYADGRIHAALNRLIPLRVCANDHRIGCNNDGACAAVGGICPPAPEHLVAFDATDGHILWSDEIGQSYSSVAVVNGVVYTGTNQEDDAGASSFYAYDAATGTRLATFALPATSAARAAVDGDTLFVGYGVGGAGGLRAYSLCGNGELDPGEACDPPDAACCLPTCQSAPADTSCDDGDACTSDDVCGGPGCAGRIATVEALECVLAPIGDRPCGDETVPKGLAKNLARQHAAMKSLLERAARASGSSKKVERLRRKVLSKLDLIARRAAKAADARQERRRITPACATAITNLTDRGRTLVTDFPF